MQPWCVKSTCDGLPEDVQLSIEYLLSDEATPEERRSQTCDGGWPPVQAACHQQQRSMTWPWNRVGWTLTLKRETQALTYFVDMVWFRGPETLQRNVLLL